MGELTTETSTYPTELDTTLALSDAVDNFLASHQNGVLGAMVNVQAELGLGLKGTLANLAARLAVNISGSGGVPGGASFPASPGPQQMFWRSDLKQLNIYDSTLGQWKRIDSTNIHSALSGLLANDHPQYAEIAETETVSAVWTFTTSPVFTANPSFNPGIITSLEIADDTIIDADISSGANISDTKLATISTPNKVSDSALSSNIPLINSPNIFTQAQEIRGGVAFIVIDATAGTPSVFLRKSGVGVSGFRGISTDTFDLIDQASVAKVGWDLSGTEGVQSQGIVPLARIQGQSTVEIDLISTEVPANSHFTHTITGVIGAEMGDHILVSLSIPIPFGLSMSSGISAADTIRVSFTNPSASGITLPPRTYFIKVIKK